jgi:hypothetical protein
LSGVGFGSGDTITSISLKDSSQPGRTLKNFRIRAKLIPATTITTTVWSANTWTNTYGPTDIPNTDIGLSFGNWKEYAFSSGLVWDGTSNIMVDISRDDTAASAGGGMYIKTDTSIGASRSLVGNCNSCTLYFAVSGTTGGAAAHNWVPTIKVTHIPAP